MDKKREELLLEKSLLLQVATGELIECVEGYIAGIKTKQEVLDMIDRARENMKVPKKLAEREVTREANERKGKNKMRMSDALREHQR